jgi:tRNA-uridine 2-sulfurtransferase
MKNWDEDDEPGYCAAEADLAMAREVAAHLGIPLHKANYAPEYWERVFAHFLPSTRPAGRRTRTSSATARSSSLRCSITPAGWAPRTSRAGTTPRPGSDAAGAHLLRAVDADKDQTYFLCRLTQEQLRPALFPLGDLLKTDVRRIALDLGLPNHARKDSTGICFIGERRFPSSSPVTCRRRRATSALPRGRSSGGTAG